jgi:hypothetical protein
MSMILKLDENKQAVLQDGKPVYVGDDGTDFVADVPSMHANILKGKGDAKKDRETITGFNKTLKLFDGVEDIPAWHVSATKALDTVKNLDDKTLVDAGKVEQVKAEVKEAYEGQVGQLKTTIKDNETAHGAMVVIKDRVIHRLTVGNHFATDPHFTGAEPLTNMLPGPAEAYFGHHFKVLPVEGKPGDVKVVGYINGNEILSRKADTVGDVAEFPEAMAIIIEQYPQKNHILTAGLPGSGAGGGGGGGGGGEKDAVEELTAQHALALKEGRGRDAVALKTRLFKATQEAAKKK